MFDMMAIMAPAGAGPPGFRWRLAEEDGGQPMLFAEEDLVDRHVGIGEYRGLEFLHVNAKRVINEVPAASHMPFRYTINAYRGCSHACGYCAGGDTPILMADGRTKRLADVRVGDGVYGTIKRGKYRRFVPTTVEAHWSTVQPAFRVTLADGTTLVASADHRFLSYRGWKHVTGFEQGRDRRPHLTLNDELSGIGRFAVGPKHGDEYRRGYLCGVIRGDAHLGVDTYRRRNGTPGSIHQFRLAMADSEALERSSDYLSAMGIATRRFCFSEATDLHRRIDAIVSQSRSQVERVREIIQRPVSASDEWCKGYLAGIFDAEGSPSQGVMRISNSDPVIMDWLTACLRRLGFRFAVEINNSGTGRKLVRDIRLRGGLPEHFRFLHTVDPANTGKWDITGTALKSDVDLRVVSIESLGFELPMFDITTGTGDFIANGVVSHNCFARPTHEYLGLNIGEDFERKLVVKVNAVERVKAELRSPKWEGDPIAMGTNTDPYQRAEGRYHLTRGIVEALGEACNPFSILTKSTLILRDLDVLLAAAARTEVHCNFSIGTLDEAVWKETEPGAPHPRRRVEAVRKLNDAGIPTGVLVAPVIPGMSDGPEQLEEVIEACTQAGATSISAIPLHLRPGVKEHFLESVRLTHPDLHRQLLRRYRGAYLPAADQDAIVSRVRVAIGRRRFVTGHERAATPGPVRAAPRGPRSEQLGFSLPGAPVSGEPA